MKKITKLTIAATLATALVAASLASAGPVTIAVYSFSSAGDVDSFKRVLGKSCTRKWRKKKTFGISVGEKTNACAFRSSVIGDSSGSANFEIQGEVNLASSTPAKLRKKIYMGVTTRSNNFSGYTLRLFPAARQWQLIRDPAGSGGPAVLAQGKGRFIRLGVAKRNRLLLRAFDYGTKVPYLLAKVNKKTVFKGRDTAPKPPTGRRAEIVQGARGKAFAYRSVGAFDNIAIRVPDPF